MKTRKFLSVLLCCLIALPLFCFNLGCSNDSSENLVAETSEQVYATEYASNNIDNYKMYLNKKFNNKADRSCRQGYNGWYYYAGTPGSSSKALEKMVYHEGSGRWCSVYHGLYGDTYTYIWKDWFPSGNSEVGVGMSFMFPATGTASITIKLKLLCDPSYISSGGVIFKVGNSAGTLLTQKTITSTSDFNKEITLPTLSLARGKGEEIFFTLYSVNSSTNTYTDVDITVQYTGGI